jgi:acylphosphatase
VNGANAVGGSGGQGAGDAGSGGGARGAPLGHSPVRWRLRVHGRVQGVGYRWFARSAAGELGVTGWVRNEADGSVCCEAQAPADVLERLLERLRRGPPLARVDSVAVETLAPRQGEERFEVHRGG